MEAFTEALAGFSPEYVKHDAVRVYCCTRRDTTRNVQQDGELAFNIPLERRGLVETALHQALLALLAASHAAQTPVMEFCGPVGSSETGPKPLLPRMLDFALHLADVGQAEPSTWVARHLHTPSFFSHRCQLGPS